MLRVRCRLIVFFGIVFSRTRGLVWLGFSSSGLVSFLVSLGFLAWLVWGEYWETCLYGYRNV